MMKLRRTLGGILFGVGCAFAFIALISLILPSVENDQLKLVLASFDMEADHPVVDLMNRGMSYALHNGWQVLIFSAVLMAAGLLMLLLFNSKPQRAPVQDPYRRPEAAQPPVQWESPASSEPQANPFASAALWEHQFAPAKRQAAEPENPFPVYGGPMLERNRIDAEPSYAFAPEQHYARPAEAEEPKPEVKHEPVNEPVSLFEKRGASPAAAPMLEKPQITAEVEKKPEPVYTPNEDPEEPVMLSSRIRSTIGRRREW